MHWEKSPPAAPARSRPYQGVRVRDPVKELLRRKRSLELHSRTASASTAGVIAHNNHPSYTQGTGGCDVPGGASADLLAGVSDEELQCTEWKAPPSAAGSGQQAAGAAWSNFDSPQDVPPAQNPAYLVNPTLTADVYMQTVCPSYTMLTYAHTPLLTNFGTFPVAPAPRSFPQMDLPDSGVAYFPWAQSLTTISTMSSSGVQFAPGAAALPAPLVHMPLSMSLTTMIPPPEPQNVHPQHPTLDYLQHSDYHQDQGAEEDLGVEPQSPNLLDKLLEEQKEAEEAGKDSYSFIPHV